MRIEYLLPFVAALNCLFAAVNPALAKNWTLTSAPPLGWTCVASSADGAKLVSAGRAVYISTNSGTTRAAAGAPSTNWTSVAMSEDGSKLVAVVSGGGIYTWQSIPTPSLHHIVSGSNALLSWTIPSMDFTLQQNADLTTTNWTDVTTPPILNLTNLQKEVVVPLLSTGNRFYRLRYLNERW